MYIQVFTTIDSKVRAETLAKTLLEKRIAGCIQIIGPITSIYWWNNKIEREKEWILLIKSREKNYKEIERTIKEIHPYQIPEIIAVPIISGSRNYLNWLDKILVKNTK
ncbi:MAG: divalent-cation tolerance protein CutA [Thermoprotei archaeon]|nr:MAG: divalent-cation tolerance protein CutA [Thermoprotei archaeon]RLE70922.1 MAG: divalent-cation tolerance protein CutA [Thermoprotei archaeon]